MIDDISAAPKARIVVVLRFPAAPRASANAVMENPDGVRTAARTVAERVRDGKRVLVHCAAGLNRSGVVSARALMFLGYPVAEAIARVRAARGPFALSKPGLRGVAPRGGRGACAPRGRPRARASTPLPSMPSPVRA